MHCHYLMKGFLFLLFTVFALPGHGQLIDNMASYRTIQADRYFRLHYENDYFSETDYYYTQGINLEYVHPAISKFPLTRLLIRANAKKAKYGISLEHLGFTPTSISHPEILKGDRPFAASVFLKTFAIVNDSTHGYRIVSALSTGVIGPAAGGQEMQATIHRWIHDTDPLGWNNQIQNDIVLNYQLDYEQKLLPYKKYFSSTAKAGVHVGTWSDKIYSSVSFMTGLFDNPFQYFSRQHRLFQVYVYEEPIINAVGYDATLQGGFFNTSSPYTISAGDVTRIVFQNNMGLVLKIRKLNIEYFQTFLTKEFRTGTTHHWGGIRLGWSLRKFS